MNLVVANADEKRARDRLTYDAWGERLTPEQYLQREERLSAHPWAQEAMTWWLWRDAGGTVLSSCETYRMCSAVEDERGESWAVASVYTEPARRGQGHARAMLDALLVRARQAGAQASTLFSDVGTPIYERSGYVARPAEDLVFPPAPGDPAHGVDALVEAIGALEPPIDDFALWPTPAQLDWHLERTRTYAALLGRPPLPSIGARAGDGVAYWTADWKHDRLLLCGSTPAAPTKRRRWCGRRATSRRRPGCTRCGCGRSRGRSPGAPISAAIACAVSARCRCSRRWHRRCAPRCGRRSHAPSGFELSRRWRAPRAPRGAARARRRRCARRGVAGNSSPSICADSGWPGCSSSSSSIDAAERFSRVAHADGGERLGGGAAAVEVHDRLGDPVALADEGHDLEAAVVGRARRGRRPRGRRRCACP